MKSFFRLYRPYLLSLMFLLTPLFGLADEVRVWNRDPITIVLPVGQEIRVTFPVDVNIQIPMTIAQQLESLAPNQQVIYWKATAPFEKARVVASSTDNESVYLVDLIADPQATTGSIVIEDPERIKAAHIESVESGSTPTTNATTELSDPPEIVLTRFAAQTLYAPRRLVPTSRDIYPVNGVQIPLEFPLLRSQAGEKYRYRIVGSWSGYGRYITAVLVINQSPIQLQINPGLVQGNFTHITPQHLYLGPKGSLEDRTTLYLISESPFLSALQEDGYGY